MRYIPSFRKRGTRQGASRLNLRVVKFLLVSVALLLVSFALAFYLFFPAKALQERIEQEFAVQTGADLRIGTLSLLFPAGVQAERLVVTGIPARDRLDVASLALTPAWRTLTGSDPGVHFSSRFQGGVVQGSALKSGALQARASRIAFDESLMPGSALRISGTLEEGSYSGRAQVRPDTETRLNLVLQRVALTGLEGLGASQQSASLGTITLGVTGRGNALRIETLTAEGGALEASGSGSIVLANPTERSRINLTLTLRPGADFDPNLRDLLTLFAQPAGDGSLRLRLTGTLGAPVLAM